MQLPRHLLWRASLALLQLPVSHLVLTPAQLPRPLRLRMFLLLPAHRRPPPLSRLPMFPRVRGADLLPTIPRVVVP